MTDRALAGLVGEIVTRVRSAHAPGEVRVLLRGSYETLIAYCDDPVARGAVVLVTGQRSPGAVDVVPWASSAPAARHALGMSGQDEE